MNVGLWFVVPVHGRLQLAAICLQQLRRTCDATSEVLFVTPNAYGKAA